MLWIKAFHILSVIAWFAGLLYLPRIFVYHADCEDEAGRNRFARMESRLFWLIMTPAMIFSLVFGMTLLAFGFSGGWIGAKLFFVFLLVIFHLSCVLFMSRLRRGVAPDAKFFRHFNEIPTFLLIFIIYLVTLKPF